MERIGPKYKICRRLGSDVFEKCQTQKYVLSEQKKSKTLRGKRRKILTDYGRQLLEKQKVRFMYGLSEKQFKNLVNESIESRGKESTALLYEGLEKRLDNVVYRLGLANTRRMARQMVSHGHILVNGKKTTVPSHRVEAGDKISIREGSKDKTLISSLELEKAQAPNWLSYDHKKIEAKVVGDPSYEEREASLDLSTVIEFYSK